MLHNGFQSNVLTTKQSKEGANTELIIQIFSGAKTPKARRVGALELLDLVSTFKPSTNQVLFMGSHLSSFSILV